MKAFITLFCLSISSLSFAQGLLTEKPKSLVLEAVRNFNGDSHLAHVGDSFSYTKVLFKGDRLLKFQDYLLTNQKTKIYCDGDYSLVNDFHGNQFLALDDIDVCINEEGWLVAYNEKLSGKEVDRRAGVLLQSIPLKSPDASIFEGTSQKEISDQKSSSYKISTTASEQ